MSDLAVSMCQPLRVACVGDSLTRGDGIHEQWHRPDRRLDGRGNYPAALQGLLGPLRVRVENFGHGGTTACNTSDSPYIQTREFRRAVKFRPHLIVLMLGTNDGKDGNWNARCDPGARMLTRGLAEIVSALGAAPTLLLVPPPILREKWRIRQRHLVHVRRAVRRHANRSARVGCEAGGLWLATPAQRLRHEARGAAAQALWRYYTADGVHLNDAGSREVACAASAALLRGCAGRRLALKGDEAEGEYPVCTLDEHHPGVRGATFAMCGPPVQPEPDEWKIQTNRGFSLFPR